MRIVSGYQTNGVQNAKTTKKKSGVQGFAVESDSGTPSTSAAQTNAAENVGQLGALLALQGVEDPLNGPRQRMRRQANDLLDELEGLKTNLLVGRLNGAEISKIKRLANGLEKSGDSGLDSILDEIGLRARVELAKLGIFNK